jgi:cell division protein FtsL
LRLPAEAADLHVSGQATRGSGDEARGQGERHRNIQESALTQREVARVAKSSLGMRGRSLVAILLGAFVLIALAIVWRRTIGINQSERLASLDAKRVTLESERARLEAEIRDASSRQNLGSTVERRLGMHVPTDKQVVILPRVRQ